MDRVGARRRSAAELPLRGTVSESPSHNRTVPSAWRALDWRICRSRSARCEIVTHDAKPLRTRPRPCRRHAARRVSRRSGPRRVRARRPRGGARHRARARAGGGGDDPGARPACRSCAATRTVATREGARARLRAALRRDRASAHLRARRDGRRGRQDRHLPHGRDHGAPHRPRGGARGAGRPSSPASRSSSARRRRWRASCSKCSA